MSTTEQQQIQENSIDQSAVNQSNSFSYVPQMQVKNQFIPSIGHPLQTNWKFWYVQRIFANPKDQLGGQNQAHQESHSIQEQHKKGFATYRDKLKDMGQISTIEQFFQYFVYMKKPSAMPREIDLFFFRENEIPMWEESPNGGIWITKIKKEDNIDKMWESLLLALISEQFEEPKVIGMGLSLRTKERLLEVWIKDGRNEKVRTNVSNKLRQILNLDPDNVTLYYKEHQKSIKDQSTMKNAEGFKFMKEDKKHKQYHGGKYQDHHNKNWGSANNNYENQQNTGGYRKKSNQFGGNGGDKPFSHLGASYPDEKQKVYRVKAPSHQQQ